MAKSISVFLAFLFHYCGFYMSMKPNICQESPPITEVIFMIATFILLRYLTLYPKSYRRLHWIPTIVAECMVAKLLQESILHFLWYPLDNFLHTGLVKWIYIISNLFGNGLDLYKLLGGCKFSIVLSYTAALTYMAIIVHALGIFEVNISRLLIQAYTCARKSASWCGRYFTDLFLYRVMENTDDENFDEKYEFEECNEGYIQPVAD